MVDLWKAAERGYAMATSPGRIQSRRPKAREAPWRVDAWRTRSTAARHWSAVGAAAGTGRERDSGGSSFSSGPSGTQSPDAQPSGGSSGAKSFSGSGEGAGAGSLGGGPKGWADAPETGTTIPALSLLGAVAPETGATCPALALDDP